MLPARLTPRRVLWLVGACLLLLPAFASAADSHRGHHAGARPAHHLLCRGHIGPIAGTPPLRKSVEDDDAAESDDLIGDSWLAPCALPERAPFDLFVRGAPDE